MSVIFPVASPILTFTETSSPILIFEGIVIAIFAGFTSSAIKNEVALCAESKYSLPSNTTTTE